MVSHRISSGVSSAEIDLFGGRLASLQISGQEVLVTNSSELTGWGSFPMIPWCGRLAFGKLNFEGKTHHFPIDNGPHSIHGLTHIAEWEIAEHSSESISITTELVESWPFGGLVRQTFSLSDDSLMVEGSIEAGSQSMPVMIGWHPWFRRQLNEESSLTLNVEPYAMYERTSEMTLTGELVPVSRQPWDDCFIGLKSAPTISWPNAFDLKVESSFDHWVIYTEPEHGICVEPQSGPPNQANSDPQILEPGQTLQGWMKLSWQPN